MNKYTIPILQAKKKKNKPEYAGELTWKVDLTLILITKCLLQG